VLLAAFAGWQARARSAPLLARAGLLADREPPAASIIALTLGQRRDLLGIPCS